MARGEAERGEGRCGREALEDAVEVAGVAEVLQPRGWARAGAPRRRVASGGEGARPRIGQQDAGQGTREERREGRRVVGFSPRGRKRREGE